jgi:NAD(P)-dependent dehydrogenase (short-subunit alcohol dehydrogenase family)
MKAAIVTGALGGIGQAVVRRFERDGYEVVPIDLNPDNKPGVTEIDLADPLIEEKFDAVLRRLPHASVLIHCAGRYEPQGMFELSLESFSHTFDVNARSVFLTSRAFARSRMAQGQPGAIVNVSSIAVRLGSTVLDYAASKAAVEAITKSMAKNLAGSGIRVNAVSPGIVDTAMGRRVPKEVLEERVKIVPLKRMAAPEEIASVIAFLASDDASYVTGQTLSVCGGLA